MPQWSCLHGWFIRAVSVTDRTDALPVMLVLAMEGMQVCRRCYETFFVNVFSKTATMTLFHYVLGMVFYLSIGVCVLVGVHFQHLQFPSERANLASPSLLHNWMKPCILLCLFFSRFFCLSVCLSVPLPSLFLSLSLSLPLFLSFYPSSTPLLSHTHLLSLSMSVFALSLTLSLSLSLTLSLSLSLSFCLLPPVCLMPLFPTSPCLSFSALCLPTSLSVCLSLFPLLFYFLDPNT